MVRKRGLTIFELIITLSVLLILARTSWISMGSMLHGRRLKRSAYEVLATVRNYSAMAAHMGVDIDIWFDARTKYLIAARQSRESELELGRHKVLSRGIKLVSARFGNLGRKKADKLTLRADGGATPGRFVLRGINEQRCEIIQAIRGASRVQCF